jgi:CDGSH-type Zn-finger protein/uncharacterized Fe-S cluster protein YjdI
MNDVDASVFLGDRELLLHALYEAAELEHNLMCTYLYAAFSLRSGQSEGLSAAEAEAVGRWRRVLLDVAIEEMGHLTAVWNITSAIGGTPRLGRTNFPIDPGYLPASVVVKLAPLNAATLQHFIYLERPHGSGEIDGEGFAAERQYRRGAPAARLTPMAIDYDTVGDFYQSLAEGLRTVAGRCGEATLFCGDPALQLAGAPLGLPGVEPVICLKTALAAFEAIVLQGEGAPRDAAGSHFQRFLGLRAELSELQQRNPQFSMCWPVAVNPVLRRPPRPEGRVWLEDPDAIAVVDLANASYGLMLRLLGYAYGLRAPSAEKSLAVDLAVGLMRAVAPLGERAARLPAGQANPGCHAGMSFTTLRDAAPLPPGRAARRLFVERLERFAAAATALRSGEPRTEAAATQFVQLAERARQGFDLTAAVPEPTAAGSAVTAAASATADAVTADAATAVASTVVGAPDGVERVRGKALELSFDARRCIHSRFCVTLTPQVFLANVQGPWIHPDAAEVQQVIEVAHACPSGAIHYHRLDGAHDELAPAVNLASVREAGPYAFRAPLLIDGREEGYRATLCRCGASKNKPFCDGSHHAVGFAASGEPQSGQTAMLPLRDGPLQIAPQTNGPLSVQGNLEIISGTGRVVARVTSARLCRCGGSANKPFCDGTHARIGFNSSN